MKTTSVTIIMVILTSVLIASVSAEIPILWQTDLNHTAANTISGIKLTPNNDNLIVFHYTGYAYGIPGRFEKLNALDGNIVWSKTVTKSGQRIALSGWVDNNENLYFGGSWGSYTLWKYDSTLSTQLGTYTGGTGFEYVCNIITDDVGNIYAAGHVGSWSGAPSTVVKLNSNCNLLWTSSIGSYTGSKDNFTYGLALDSNGNVFHVGNDFHPGFPACRGRIIGHSASNGAVYFNKLVDESNSGVYGVITDTDNKIYAVYSYNLRNADQSWTLAERSAILKLNQDGSIVWRYNFDDIGMYLPSGCIVKHTDNSFYVAFQLHKNGTSYPGIAEIDSNGNLLWKDTIDKPGWEMGQSNFDADGGYLYLGLNNPNDGTKTTVLCLKKPFLAVSIDIKPTSCPNPLNVKSKGVLPVAILGLEEFDVSTIDVASIHLNGVQPIRSSLEDVATPLTDPIECECTTNGPDGYLDLTLKFDTQKIVETLEEVNKGDILTLPLTGVLYDETPIEGADCIVIVGRHKPINEADINKDGVVNSVDMAIVAENWLESSI